MSGDKLPPDSRSRARELDIRPGVLEPGPLDAITDVAGVWVGHVTAFEGEDIRTGATAILPHGGNVYQEKVPAGLAVGNGYGKLCGGTQVQELGEIETPIVLTNTLAVPRAADAILDWVLDQPGNEEVRSANPVVGETNDGRLNDIRRRVLTSDRIRQAIERATDGPVVEGAVGAGTGTVALGWKGGIGTSSRMVSQDGHRYTLGALVQSNFGGMLQVLGVPVGRELAKRTARVVGEDLQVAGDRGGSIMIVLATDAPLSDRNLTRLARRALAGLARTGASMHGGSGDYAIAFSTAENVRRTPARRGGVSSMLELPNERVSQLFTAAIEATEEAIYNSLFMATTVTGYRGLAVQAIPLGSVMEVMHAYRPA